ncbi:hypothetical protein [Streptomyces sp. NBC_00696]|uniref:hypothetical protein n=1 Tax=Streptomyces sp. NBC_00696 TaxID=2903672 RepID=UPI002E317229|nr:hypothetical protein [Streptomyces sp. NBC_00696]
MTDEPEEDSYIDVPVWMPVSALKRPWLAAVSGQHHIPSFGTVTYRKRWCSTTIRAQFRAVDAAHWQSFATDWTTMVEIITAGTLGEARTLISLCLPAT